MPSIKCMPEDRNLTAKDGDTVLRVLLGAGVSVAHACGGRARCSTCRILVTGGIEHLADRSEDERELAARLRLPDDIRLACQTRVEGDVEIRRLVLDAEDEAIATGIGPNGEVATVGREVDAAVLFADVVGFTPLSESLPPYDVIHMLNRYFRGVNRVVDAEGGCVDNYMGDGFLALFGVDGAPDATLRAVRAGLAVHEVAEAMDEYTRTGYCQGFKVRVGIHFGPLVVGRIGSSRRPRETAIGDSVNFASRIEAANKECGTRTLLSEDAYRQVAGRVETGKLCEVALKGKSGRHRLFEVVGLAGPEG